MKISKILMIAIMVCVLLTLVACGGGKPAGCDHEWKAATCTEPRTCTICYEKMGNPMGHKGGKATCTAKAVCETCNSEYGELDSSNHTGNVGWAKTANTHNEAYDCCGAKVSNAENHTKINGICTVCGFDPIIGASSVEISTDGKTATVVISITDNPGILGLEMSVSFDTASLVLKTANSGSAMNGLAFTAPDDISKGGKFLWDGIDTSAGDAKNGEVLVLTFDLSEAPAGSYSILLKANAYDSELNSLSFKIENGMIKVG